MAPPGDHDAPLEEEGDPAEGAPSACETSEARARRLAEHGVLAGAIAHELRNPLGVIESSLYLISKKPDLPQGVEAHLDRIRSQVRRSNDIIAGLLALIKDEPVARQPVSLAAVVEEAIEQTKGEARVATNLPGDLPDVLADRRHAFHVVSNVLQNAHDALGGPGNVELSAKVEGPQVILTIRDDGPGIDPDVAATIFDALVTTKSGGTGLGLALCKRLMSENGGRIELSDAATGSGASFDIVFERAEAGA